MNILLLGPKRDHIQKYLISFGDKVDCEEDKIDSTIIIEKNYDFIISYGYRFILSKEVVRFYKEKLINLHISFLPWNRGADPNFWSFLENTPKGVTIHYIDEGIDTGDIIAQRQVEFSNNETLATSYRKLTIQIEDLFYEVWPLIRAGKNDRICQKGIGSFHKLADKNKYFHLLVNGWDTKVSCLELYGKGEENT